MEQQKLCFVCNSVAAVVFEKLVSEDQVKTIGCCSDGFCLAEFFSVINGSSKELTTTQGVNNDSES